MYTLKCASLYRSVYNTKFLAKENMTSVEAMEAAIMNGHIYRLDNSRLPAIVLYGRPKRGKRRRCCQSLRYTHCTKRSTKRILNRLHQEVPESDEDRYKELGTAGYGPPSLAPNASY